MYSALVGPSSSWSSPLPSSPPSPARAQRARVVGVGLAFSVDPHARDTSLVHRQAHAHSARDKQAWFIDHTVLDMCSRQGTHHGPQSACPRCQAHQCCPLLDDCWRCQRMPCPGHAPAYDSPQLQNTGVFKFAAGKQTATPPPSPHPHTAHSPRTRSIADRHDPPPLIHTAQRRPTNEARPPQAVVCLQHQRHPPAAVTTVGGALPPL
jgi:hypothetical protein